MQKHLQHLSTSRILIKSMCTWQIFKLDFLQGKVTKENIYSALSNYFSTEDNLLYHPYFHPARSKIFNVAEAISNQQVFLTTYHFHLLISSTTQ